MGKMKYMSFLFFSMIFLTSCEDSQIVKIVIDGKLYQTPLEESLKVESGDITYFLKRYEGTALDNYLNRGTLFERFFGSSGEYLNDLHAYLIKGSKIFENGKTHLYHFYKEGNDSQSIFILATCPYDINEKYKEEIFRVVKSAHF